jgi:hypothetical protein
MPRRPHLLARDDKLTSLEIATQSDAGIEGAPLRGYVSAVPLERFVRHFTRVFSGECMKPFRACELSAKGSMDEDKSLPEVRKKKQGNFHI